MEAEQQGIVKAIQMREEEKGIGGVESLEEANYKGIVESTVVGSLHLLDTVPIFHYANTLSLHPSHKDAAWPH